MTTDLPPLPPDVEAELLELVTLALIGRAMQLSTLRHDVAAKVRPLLQREIAKRDAEIERLKRSIEMCSGSCRSDD